jgi:hypothetical protein
MNSLLDIHSEREFERALTEIRGNLLEKIENTPIERDMPELLIRFLERLIKNKDSGLAGHLNFKQTTQSSFTS